MSITTKGRILALELGQSGEGYAAVVCSRICRSAVSYQRVEEMVCNGHPAMGNPHIDIKTANRLQERHEKWCEKRETALENNIRKWVDILGALPGVPVSGVEIGGDPRGVCVKLIRTDGKSNSWGGESRWCVPLEG